MVISLVRRLLDANDRILSLASSTQRERAIRVGVADLYAREVMRILGQRSDRRSIHLYSDHSDQIAKGISEAYVDIGCGMFGGLPSRNIIATWEEKLVWARSPDFLISPGGVIPLISWPDIPSDRIAIETLERIGSRYEIVFASYDHEARVAAVAAGAGVVALPERFVRSPLVVSRDYYLPPLSTITAGVFCREGVDLEDFPGLLDNLVSIAPNASAQSKPFVEKADASINQMRAAVPRRRSMS